MNTQAENRSILTNPTVLERAVIYGRVSGDDTKQEGRNIKGQLEMGREHCQQKSYRIIAELYEDPKKHTSGYEIDLPVLTQILEMARNHEFDVLVVRELDRLSRNLAKQLIVEEELKRCGVRVEYVMAEYEDTSEGRLNKHLRASIAEYEREKIRERTMRGRRQKVKEGNVLVFGRPPYGYSVVKKAGKATFEIVETEATIVKQIFDWYLDGLPIMGIRRKLNEIGVPPPIVNKAAKGRLVRSIPVWTDATVHRMLKCQTYAGTWTYGKTNSRQQTKNSPDTWLTVAVPAIVTQEQWELVQARFAQNLENSKRNMKHEYLLAKRCRCGCCGYKMYSQRLSTQLYYRCPAQCNDNCTRECNLPLFQAALVDAKLWAELEEVITDDKKLEKGLRGYQAEQDEITKPLRDELRITVSLIEQRTADWERKMTNLDAVEGKLAKASIGKEITQIEQELERLEKEKVKLVQQIEKKTMSEEQIMGIKKFTAMMAADLERFRHDFPSRRMLIEMLDLEATLFVEDGKRKVRAFGKVGPILVELHHSPQRS